MLDGRGTWEAEAQTGQVQAVRVSFSNFDRTFVGRLLQEAA